MLNGRISKEINIKTQLTNSEDTAVLKSEKPYN